MHSVKTHVSKRTIGDQFQPLPACARTSQYSNSCYVYVRSFTYVSNQLEIYFLRAPPTSTYSLSCRRCNSQHWTRKYMLYRLSNSQLYGTAIYRGLLAFHSPSINQVWDREIERIHACLHSEFCSIDCFSCMYILLARNRQDVLN